MPGGTFRLQNAQRIAEVLLRSSAHGKFHDEQRQRKHEQKKQVGDHEDRTAVFSRYIGKSPYVAEAYGASGGYEKKADAAGHFLTLHDDSTRLEQVWRMIFLGRPCARKRVEAIS